jgi:hypothetical protein
MTRSLNPAPADAFDRAAKQTLRDAPLPSAPDWLDAQITAAARTQAGIYAAQTKPRAQSWWQAPWLKVALPALAVTSVLIAVWLPQTQVTPSAIQLPEGVQLNEPVRPANPAEPAAQPAIPPAAVTEQKRDAAPSAPTPPPAPAAKAAQTPKDSPVPRRASPPTSVERQSAAASASAPAGAAAASAPALTASTSAANAAAPSRNESAAPAPAEPAAPANAPGSKFMTRTQSAHTESARAAAPMNADVTRARDAQASSDQATPAEIQSAQAKELEAIRALLREGQRDAAAKRLVTLVERTPAFQVPEDLRFLLAKP